MLKDIMEQAAATTLTFTLNKESGELTAHHTPNAPDGPLTREAFVQAMIAGGYDKFASNVDITNSFLEKCESAKTPHSVVIAKRRDGEFTLTMSEDKMLVSLTLTPPAGGRAKNVEVIRALQDLGVVHGILHLPLREALKAGQCKELIVAEGTWPSMGTPVTFDSLLEEIEKELSEVDEDAVIQYSDLGHLLLVNPGDKLMRRTPAVPGTDGIDVLGQKVLTRPVANLTFNPDSIGAIVAPDDENLLIAEIAGQPKLISNGVKVNSIVEIENVDLSTGNIDFEGTIRISGDVKSGMRLHASGDVFVNGMVEAAEIVAGGDITIKGGIIGATDVPGGTASTGPAMRIASKTGSVQALFAQNVTIEAAKGILISGNASQCDMTAGEEIIIGKNNSTKAGQLVGGRAQATNLIKAVSFGAPNGTTTRLHVGSDPQWADKLHAKEKELHNKTGELEYTIKLINHIKSSGKQEELDTLPEADAKRIMFVEEVRVLNKELQDMRDGHVPLEKSRIVATKAFNEGVEIRIGKQITLVSSVFGAGTARLHQDKIAFGK
jgi:uncharacterized protein (DUF342 family)